MARQQSCAGAGIISNQKTSAFSYRALVPQLIRVAKADNNRLSQHTASSLVRASPTRRMRHLKAPETPLTADRISLHLLCESFAAWSLKV